VPEATAHADRETATSDRPNDLPLASGDGRRGAGRRVVKWTSNCWCQSAG